MISKTQAQKICLESWSQFSDGVNCLSRWFSIFMKKKIVSCQETLKKAFWAAVKLHCLTSKNKYSHNLWYNDWMSVCSEMLGLSGLQWYWPKKKLISNYAPRPAERSEAGQGAFYFSAYSDLYQVTTGWAVLGYYAYCTYKLKRKPLFDG